jgi:hypothetical protein
MSAADTALPKALSCQQVEPWAVTGSASATCAEDSVGGCVLCCAVNTSVPLLLSTSCCCQLQAVAVQKGHKWAPPMAPCASSVLSRSLAGGGVLVVSSFLSVVQCGVLALLAAGMARVCMWTQ